jgi:signal transduction histidine kinase
LKPLGERKDTLVGHSSQSQDSSSHPAAQKIWSAFIDRYRYSTLGELLKGIIHNLNGSLQILSMQMELLQRALAHEDAKIQDQVKRSLGQIDRFKGMLDPLIQKGVRDEQDSPQPINLNEILEEELSLLHHNLFFKHHVRVQKDLSSPLPPMKGYSVDFSQGLSNLIRNALEAMENSDPKELTLTTRVRGERVTVAIQDTGRGIPEEIKPHLFKPFFTSKGGKHPGIGLYLARELLAPYEASFHFYSGEKGTVFEVHFPLSSGGPVRKGPSGS